DANMVHGWPPSACGVDRGSPCGAAYATTSSGGQPLHPIYVPYVFAAAVLIEAGLSFLGAGTPSQVPTWGNVIAEVRTFFQVAFWRTLSRGLPLSAPVLPATLLGAGPRPALAPRLAGRL